MFLFIGKGHRSNFLDHSHYFTHLFYGDLVCINSIIFIYIIYNKGKLNILYKINILFFQFHFIFIPYINILFAAMCGHWIQRSNHVMQLFALCVFMVTKTSVNISTTSQLLEKVGVHQVHCRGCTLPWVQQMRHRFHKDVWIGQVDSVWFDRRDIGFIQTSEHDRIHQVVCVGFEKQVVGFIQTSEQVGIHEAECSDEGQQELL